MAGITLLLNLAVVIWLLLGLLGFACWASQTVSCTLYHDKILKYFLVTTAVILGLGGLLRFVRMEE